MTATTMTQIQIGTALDRVINLEVEESDTINTIKTKLQDKTRIPRHVQCLMRQGIELDDDRTWSDCNFSNSGSRSACLDVAGKMCNSG